MKKLVTDRLILRAWQESDLLQFHNNCKNVKVGPMAGWKPHETMEESKEILDLFMAQEETWAIVLKEGGRLIGSIGLHKDAHRVDIENVYMLGYVLSEEYWGRSFIYEACREVIRYAFEELQTELLSVSHFSFNEQSKRVIQKCGFTFEGVLRYAYKRRYDGKIFDDCAYSMTRAEFLRNRKVNHSNDIQREMSYGVVKMSKVNAYAFLEWQYEPPFESYTCPLAKREEELENIMAGKPREYFAVYDCFGDLCGVYDYAFTGEGKLNIEFRMKPEVTNRGFGKSFVRECLHFGRMQYQYDGDIVLRVASGNIKGREILETMGFVETHNDTEMYHEKPTGFIYMELRTEHA
ncbi:MAG: GNAT family protein [Oscillospiraceae bacterium]